MDKVVIIGGGVAGLTAAENAVQAKKDAKVIMISEESYYPYSRIKLSKYLYNHFEVDELYLKKEQWYKDMGIEVLLGRRVQEINPDEGSIVLDNQEKISYNSLILANGSYSFLPPIPGSDKGGVFTVRKIDDVINIQNYIRQHGVSNVAVIGGGLLGIEAAWAFREADGNFNISIIEAIPRLLPRQLDEEGSEILQDIIEKNKMELHTGVSVKEILGESSVRGIVLSNGTEIPADLVIVSAGIRSNIDLPSKSGIKVGRGVIVDGYMRTNFNNIYAAGDIAEYNGNVWGIWPVAVEQGKIAGLNAAQGNAKYNEITPSSLLQVIDIKVFSTGIFSGDDVKEVKYDNGLYTKLFFRKNVICGGIFVGDTKKGFAVKRAIEESRSFEKELNENVNILHII